MIEESFTLALKVGEWKYIESVNNTVSNCLKSKDGNYRGQAKRQLLNLRNDIGERDNAAAKFPKQKKEINLKQDYKTKKHTTL